MTLASSAVSTYPYASAQYGHNTHRSVNDGSAAPPQPMLPTKAARARPPFRFLNNTVTPLHDARDRTIHAVSSAPAHAEVQEPLPTVNISHDKQILPSLDLHMLPEHNLPQSHTIEVNKWVIFF